MSFRRKVGVLAFQGDFAKHCEAFEKLGCDVRLVKSIPQLDVCDCFVIPGAESSVLDRFIKSTGLAEPIKEFAKSRPIWGTCAGMILLASDLTNDRVVTPLRLLDITVERNGYGRQFESFVADGEFSANGQPEPLQMVFIRAPKIAAVGKQAQILGQCQGEITIVRQGRVFATAFHPELTDSMRIQEYFLSLA